MEYQNPAHQNPEPDPEIVKKYHTVHDKREGLEQEMRNLQEQSHHEINAGKPGRGDQISEIAEQIDKLCEKEEKYRMQASQQVIDRGGIVDSGHLHASRGGTRHRNSRYRRPRSQNRRETPKPGEYLDRDQSTLPAGTDPQEIEKLGRKHKKFAHYRADVAIKRSRLPSDGSPTKPSRDVVIGYQTFWDEDGLRRGRSRSTSPY